VSHHIVSEVYKRETGKMPRTAILALLADKASDDGCGIYASKTTLADEMGCQKQTIITIIDSLLEDGLLVFVGERPCANGYTCEYRIDINALEALPLVGAHERRESRKRTGQKNIPVMKTDPTGQEVGPHRSKKQTLTTLEPSMNHSPPAPRRGEERERCSSKMPDQWTSPAIDALPPAIAALACQWPAGAYAAEAAAFHQHWHGRGQRRDNWSALWAARVQARHADVMRAAKAGVPFTAPAAAPAGTSAEDLLPVAAKRDEDDRSEELHHALVRRFGQSLYEQWYARVALVFTDCGLTVVSPSAFHASWLENHHKADIDAALGKIGRGVDWIAFRVDRKGGKAAVKAARSGGRKRAR